MKSKKSLFDLMMGFEDGSLSNDEVLILFSKLIKSGQAWTLQGFYGRTAMALINAGRLSKDGLILEQ